MTSYSLYNILNQRTESDVLPRTSSKVRFGHVTKQPAVDISKFNVKDEDQAGS